MVFRPVIHDDLGCASYLVDDEEAGVAAVVDPRYDVAEYLELARYLGVRIEHVLETHEHADHRSGHGRLAAAAGATVHIHEQALAAYEHEPHARRLTPLEVPRRAHAGDLVVDVGTELEFDEAHVPGAVSITALRAGFGSKLAWLAPTGGGVVLVGRDDDEASRAVWLAAAVGVSPRSDRSPAA